MKDFYKSTYLGRLLRNDYFELQVEEIQVDGGDSQRGTDGAIDADVENGSQNSLST